MTDRASWDETWGRLALDMRLRSRCDRVKVGCVIVSRENRVCATGYNGPPANWRNLQLNYLPDQVDDCSNWCAYAQGGGTEAGLTYDQCPSSHAEINALMHSDRRDREDGTIYITSSPCMTCAKAIANSGLLTVKIVNQDPTENYRNPEKVVDFLADCGLYVFPVEIDLRFRRNVSDDVLEQPATRQQPKPFIGPCPLCGSRKYLHVNYVDVGMGNMMEQIPGTVSCDNPNCPPDYSLLA